jgi:hypothetical protein
MFLNVSSHSTGKYKLQIFNFEFLAAIKIRTLAIRFLIACNPTGIQQRFVEICCLHLEFDGHAVAQLVEALRYRLEGRGIDSRWCHWNFSLK